MPRKRLEFHKLSNRSKRRRINEETSSSSQKSDSSSSSFSNNHSDHNEVNDDFKNKDNEQSTSTSINLIEEMNETQFNVEPVNSSLISLSSSDETNILFHSDFDSTSSCVINSTVVYNEEETSTDIKTFLRNWAIKYNISYASLSALLVGLKGNVESLLEVLPSDARTLLKTNIQFDKIIVEPGIYLHFGLEKQLLRLVENVTIDYMDCLKLLINIDGLPLFKSSAGQVIPILVLILNVPMLSKIVFPIGMYYGLQKPNDIFQFLHPFINEIVELNARGISTNSKKKFKIQIVGFCCDAPAKKDILGIKGHSGYNSCTKCTVRGTTVDNRRVFTNLNCTLRTNEDFLNWSDTNYRLHNTPLTKIPNIDFVRSFILDYMHLVLLGVMRTLLLTWYSGNIPHKLSQKLIQVTSDFMINNRNSLPEEFVRQPRDLKYLLRWKATEFRTFLLYSGPVALRGVLDANKYKNFLTLHVAISILLNSKSCNNKEMQTYVKSLLYHFVQNIIVLYNESFITHNFHGLIHLVDDVEHFGPMINSFTLDSISAFPFENFLQSIKKMVRGTNKPLEQIGKRLGQLFSEYSFLFKSTITSDLFPKLKNIHCNGPLPPNCRGPQYTILEFQNFKIRISPPNNCCRVKSGDILMVENICFDNKSSIVIVGRKFCIKSDFYTIPCKSSLIGIYEVQKLSNFLEIWSIDEIDMKYVYFPYKQKFITFPLLHLS